LAVFGEIREKKHQKEVSKMKFFWASGSERADGILIFTRAALSDF
jgi:hypothetical protein